MLLCKTKCETGNQREWLGKLAQELQAWGVPALHCADVLPAG